MKTAKVAAENMFGLENRRYYLVMESYVVTNDRLKAFRQERF
jgi:hypothetical protein